MDPFQDLNDLAVNLILSKLDAKETGIVACINRRFRVWASEDSLWSRHCIEELGLSVPLDPSGNHTASFKVAYQLWREEFGMYKWALVKRVKRCWDKLKTWLSTNFPEAMATLRRGASEDELNELEKTLQVKLPLPTRVLYRFCDGQEIPEKDASLGLIGGYSFYERIVDVFILSLNHIIRFTRRFRRSIVLPGTSKYLVIGSSTTGVQKLFFLNCESGQLYVGTINLVDDGEMLPCVPNGLISAVHESTSDLPQDALLLWLEEHGRRLEKGIITVREEDMMKGISQFPELPPLCSVAVTSGVQVRASTVFVPEGSDLGAGKYLFAYSVRMSLLPDGCTVHGIRYNSCQLYWRHWLIHEDDNLVHPVNGEAVIGKYPLLLPGEKEFVYQSCTASKSRSGFIEGFFTFVPGSLSDQKGDSFEVEVARFPFNVPEYIF